MNVKATPQLSNLFEDNSSHTILKETEKIFSYHYDATCFRNVEKCLWKINELFYGDFPGFMACNTEYHDLEHTEEVFLATARLIDGFNIAGEKIDQHLALCLLIAALMHDAGYIQEEWDNNGTGAKYTITHVERGIEFVKKYQADFCIDKNDIDLIGRIIKATEFSMDFDSIEYKSPEEKIAGSILGTADLMGQMANRAYLEKLLFLYYEFKEAGIPGYDTEFDILRKTIGFYQITMDRMKTAFSNHYRYALNHFKKRFAVANNLYTEAIDANIDYLNKIINDESTNFRKKLKRGEWIKSI